MTRMRAASRQVSLGLAPAGDVHGVVNGRPSARFPWFEPAARPAALDASQRLAGDLLRPWPPSGGLFL